MQVQVHRLLSEHTVRIGLQADPGNGQPLSIGSAKHSESSLQPKAHSCVLWTTGAVVSVNRLRVTYLDDCPLFVM